MSKPTIRLIHHLARCGGTLISRCLGSMEKICLLSEINPRSIKMYNPLEQASKWHHLFDLNDFVGKPIAFHDAIEVIRKKAEEQGKTLLVRDWTHIDYTAIPFADHPAYQLSLHLHLEEHFNIKSIFTLRHPLDQWLSLYKFLRLMDVESQQRGGRLAKMTFEKFLCDYYNFAVVALQSTYFRYEDFTRNPNRELEKMCIALDAPFDPSYTEKWGDYWCITGDKAGEGRSTHEKVIQNLPRKQLDEKVEKFVLSNALYHECLRLLDYTHEGIKTTVEEEVVQI